MQPKDNKTAWGNIPLQDYEAHMSHAQVGQLQLLNNLTKKYLQLLQPASCMFLGIAGGNGLEHIDKKVTHKVIAVDINPAYLAITQERHAASLPMLETVELDIVASPACIAKAGFIWAALIFEYTGIEAGLAFCANNIARGGSLVVTIQINNGVTAISSTGVESIKQAGTVFTLVEPVALAAAANNMGFILVDEEESFLPNGKSFRAMRFEYAHG